MKTASIIRSTIIILILGITLSGWSEGFDWPQWGGPNRNWISLETGWNPKALQRGAQVVWEQNIGIGYSNLAIMGNRLFAIGLVERTSVVTCLNSDTGRILWQYSHRSMKDSHTTATVDGTSVYILTRKGLLLCLDQESGRLRWQRDLVGECGALAPYYGFAGSPVVAGNLLILNANAAGMALEKETGRLVWGSEKPPKEILEDITDDNGCTYMTPVTYEHAGKPYALIYSWKGLFSVDVATGRPLWKYSWGDYNLAKAPDPMLVGNRVLLVDDNEGDIQKRFSTLLSIETGNPKVVWKSRSFYSDVTTPIVLDGFFYCTHGGPNPESIYSSLCCLDLETGQLKWEYREKKSKQWISLSAAGEKLIVLEETGNLSILEASPAGYTEISSCRLPGGENRPRRYYTPPVLCNGRIYCRNYTGELTCIDVSK